MWFFSGIAECGIDAGMELKGYTTQAYFLINCGITTLLKDTSPEKLREYLPKSAQLQKLTSPAEMGELFKVIALGKSALSPGTSPGRNRICIAKAKQCRGGCADSPRATRRACCESDHRRQTGGRSIATNRTGCCCISSKSNANSNLKREWA